MLKERWMGGLASRHQYSIPTPNSREENIPPRSPQVPGSPALLGAFYLCYESGRAAGRPKGSHVFL